MISLADIADKTIRPREGTIDEVQYNFDTKDIQDLIFNFDLSYKHHTERLAPYISKSIAGLKSLWSLVRTHIKYKQDPDPLEDVKSPAATWDDGYGDCKSMSIFIGSILSHLKIPYKYRYVSYTKGMPVSHVYIVANLLGREVLLDACHNKFDEETEYYLADDYSLVNNKWTKSNTKIGSPLNQSSTLSTGQAIAIGVATVIVLKAIRSNSKKSKKTKRA